MSRLTESPDSGPKTSPEELAKLVQTLKSGGELTSEQHTTLERLLNVAAKREPAMMAQVAFKQEIYSGPLPPPDQLNIYDDSTRSQIVEMAVREQTHNHAMQTKSLSGAIWKDRFGQMFGFGIAIAGLGAAAWIAQYSAAAAAIIGTLDLIGMVGVFVVPRAFERRIAEQEAVQQSPSRRPKPARNKK